MFLCHGNINFTKRQNSKKKMSLYLFRPLPMLNQNSSSVRSVAMYLHKNRKYVINNKRGLACKKTAKKEPDPCDYKVCNRKVKKKPFWKRFFEIQDEKPLPPVECCRQRQQPRCDPDLSEFGGQPYRTCGPAYIIQKDILPVNEPETTKEDQILKKIEACPEFKNIVNTDPLPKFKSAEGRILDLSDKKLHPSYKRHCHLKRKHLEDQRAKLYKTVSWPVDMYEIPARFNINKELLEKKNMEYMEFKRVEPPRQLLERIVELNRNARPSIKEDKPVPVDMKEVEKRQEMEESQDTVFHTLYQKNTKF